MPDACRRTSPHDARRRWMAVLARAGAGDRATLLGAAADCRNTAPARPGDRVGHGARPDGGGGSPFNLGEMSVTRCTVRTKCGRVGHAYMAGRDERQAELAALVDAVLQDPARQPACCVTVVEPLAAAQQVRREGDSGESGGHAGRVLHHDEHARMSGVDSARLRRSGAGRAGYFRAVLDAMARPGRLHQAGVGLAAPAPLDPATAAMLLTLADGDAPVWLDPCAAPAREWVLFHAGAPIGDAAGMPRSRWPCRCPISLPCRPARTKPRRSPPP